MKVNGYLFNKINEWLFTLSSRNTICLIRLLSNAVGRSTKMIFMFRLVDEDFLHFYVFCLIEVRMMFSSIKWSPISNDSLRETFMEPRNTTSELH